MEVTMYNVGFGDFFNISNDGHALVVDCGTVGFKGLNTKYKIFNNMVEEEFDNILNAHSQKDALITHFHEDHYKGFKNYAKTGRPKFDTVYIPAVTIDAKSKEAIQLKLAIQFYTYLKEGSKTFTISENILKQISTCMDMAENVKCLEAEDTFSVGGHTFEVLWPPPSFDYDAKLAEYLQNNPLQDKDYAALSEELEKTFLRWTLTSRQQTDNPGNEDRRTALSQIRVDADKILQELDAFKKQVPEKERSQVMDRIVKHHYTRLFHNDINSTSIVFHSSEGNSLLMTGDIDAANFEKEISSKVNNWYYILKAPHHGTSTHYTKTLPDGCRRLISTGKRHDFKPISSNYQCHVAPAKIATCEDVRNICTRGDTHCETRNLGKVCKACACNNNEIRMTESDCPLKHTLGIRRRCNTTTTAI